MANLNETKVVGVVASKVSNSQMKDGKFISSFILKINSSNVHILVKFIGNRPTEFNKGDEIWLKGSLGNIKKVDGTYEIGIKASAYKIHENQNKFNELNSAVDDLLGNSNEEDPTSSFKGVGIRRRR